MASCLHPLLTTHLMIAAEIKRGAHSLKVFILIDTERKGFYFQISTPDTSS